MSGQLSPHCSILRVVYIPHVETHSAYRIGHYRHERGLATIPRSIILIGAVTHISLNVRDKRVYCTYMRHKLHGFVKDFVAKNSAIWLQSSPDPLDQIAERLVRLRLRDNLHLHQLLENGVGLLCFVFGDGKCGGASVVWPL